MTTLDATFARRYGPWAVVTGAGAGIGAAYVRQLASAGIHVVAVTLPDDPIDELARDVRAAHGTDVVGITGDVGAPSTWDAIDEAVSGRDVGLLVANAALSRIAPMLEQDEDTLLAHLQVNAAAPMVLARRLAPAMVERGRGGIVLMASLSALQATPRIAAYAATKAFDLSLGQSLWAELRPAGVDVTVCVPGTVDTPGFRSSGARGGPPPMAPEEVARTALGALGSKPVVIPGRANNVTAVLMGRLLPRRLSAQIMDRATGAMYGRG